MFNLKKFSCFVESNPIYFDYIKKRYSKYMWDVYFYICKKCYFNHNVPMEISAGEICDAKDKKLMSVSHAVRILAKVGDITLHLDNALNKKTDSNIFSVKVLENFNFEEMRDDTFQG